MPINYHGIEPKLWAKLRLFSGCRDARLDAFIADVEQIAQRWASEPEVRAARNIDPDGVAALEALADGFKFLARSKSVSEMESLLIQMSPRWHRSSTFYLHEAADSDAAIGADVFASAITDFLSSRSGGRPADGPPRTAQAIDELLKAWHKRTLMPPSDTPNDRRGSTPAFFKALLPTIKPVRRLPSPSQARRDRRTADNFGGTPKPNTPCFEAVCIEGLSRGIERWQDRANKSS